MRRSSPSDTRILLRPPPRTARLTSRCSTKRRGTSTNLQRLPAQSEDPNSVFGSIGDTIPALQERGVVFLACHNAIWEVTAKLIASGKNPDHASHEAVAAELTNHLIDSVVLTPGIVATIPELQQVGFHYAA